jgi:hypothetical protein
MGRNMMNDLDPFSFPCTCFPWKVVSASVKGLSHELNNLPCQDAILFSVCKGILIVAAADGAGSAKHSDLGAKVAVDSALRYIESIILDNLTYSDACEVNFTKSRFTTILASWDEVAVDVVRQAFMSVQTIANDSNLPIKELASTLLVVVASDIGIAALQIGDGAIIVNTLENCFVPLTIPPQTEYINETVFLISPTAIESMQINTFGKVKQLAIMTDGIQMLALEMKERKPYNPFFSTIFNFAAHTSSEEKSVSDLEKFLVSKRVRQYSHDDITLLLASLTELENIYPIDQELVNYSFPGEFTGKHEIAEVCATEAPYKSVKSILKYLKTYLSFSFLLSHSPPLFTLGNLHLRQSSAFIASGFTGLASKVIAKTNIISFDFFRKN